MEGAWKHDNAEHNYWSAYLSRCGCSIRSSMSRDLSSSGMYNDNIGTGKHKTCLLLEQQTQEITCTSTLHSAQWSHIAIDNL